ncbi:MAG: bifunctional diaminohydroxyphosphoribosylaminopyrimidine deaminase/5-amino-6-(5-phosphoribosylamino)uracil reductase RibD [bacterium]
MNELFKAAQDRKWMRRALTLARLSEGHTRPNPPVGAVVVKDGRKLGEGRHLCAGCAHAEVEALNACRETVAGATLYVTLEPCCTTGRTPPCTDRIVREGIARVVVGCRDANGCHCGRGLELLTKQGVEVVYGVCEDEALELTAPFAKHIATGYPFVTVKLAMTLDGRIADRTGCSQWVTGEAARAEVQRMRRRADVMLAGAGTVCADNPSLLCRLPGGDKLMRVIVDAAGRTPATVQVYTDDAADRTIVATTPETARKKAAAWSTNGAQVWTFAPDKAGRIPLKRLLKRLGAAGYLHVLCEGGGKLAGGLNDAGLVDEYGLFYAPAVMGDVRAASGVAGQGCLLSKLPRMRFVELKRFGEDVMMRVRKA